MENRSIEGCCGVQHFSAMAEESKKLNENILKLRTDKAVLQAKIQKQRIDNHLLQKRVQLLTENVAVTKQKCEDIGLTHFQNLREEMKEAIKSTQMEIEFLDEELACLGINMQNEFVDLARNISEMGLEYKPDCLDNGTRTGDVKVEELGTSMEEIEKKMPILEAQLAQAKNYDPVDLDKAMIILGSVEKAFSLIESKRDKTI